MGVQIISELVQKNNRDFPIVDSNNIRGGCYQVNTLDELYNDSNNTAEIMKLNQNLNENGFW